MPVLRAMLVRVSFVRLNSVTQRFRGVDSAIGGWQPGRFSAVGVRTLEPRSDCPGGPRGESQHWGEPQHGIEKAAYNSNQFVQHRDQVNDKQTASQSGV